MSRSLKKNLISLGVALLVLAVTFFTAAIEYQSNVSQQKQDLDESLEVVKNKWENVIEARVLGLKGLISYVEINPEFSQEEYEAFARGLYESQDDIVTNIALLKDTTVTYVYPYNMNLLAVGRDLVLEEGQRDFVRYTKNTRKSILDAPVELIQGGVGIVVRSPLIVEGEYWGQASFVFDYYTALRSTGMLELDKENQIQLNFVNPLNGKVKTVWSNQEENMSDPIIKSIRLYDTSMRLYGMPKDGWTGFSPLFYSILIAGFLLTVASFFGLRQLISVRDQLQENQLTIREANDRLQNANDELEATIHQLVASEKGLKEQYLEIKKQEETIQFMAERDPLTELYNRRKMVEVLRDIFQSEDQGAMMLLDIDNFKDINDSQGHIFGDRVLRQVAEVLLASAGDHWIVFRLGGDEFVLLHRGQLDLNLIEQQSEKIRRDLTMGTKVEHLMNHITVSIGVARFPRDGRNMEDLMIRADIAMYTAKRAGKNQCMMFREEMIQDFERKIHIERQLRKNLEEEGLYLLYQPVVTAEGGELRYFEALLRMGDNGISPAEFIPVAEDSGLILPVGEWVIRRVVRQLKEWEEAGLTLKPVAINISPRQVREKTFAKVLHQELESSQIPPSFIEVEITENVLLEGIDENIQVLEDLMESGISIALDDFGTGYSSLNYLTYLPVSKIKLDKTMKDRILVSGKENALKSLIDLTHGLDMEMVAEGIENQEEGRMLASQGCDFLQGYWFSPPIPAEEAGQMLKE